MTVVRRTMWTLGAALVIVAGWGTARNANLPGMLGSSSVVDSSAGAPLTQLAGLQLPFIANQGQVDKRVAYYASTFAGTVFVNRDGALVYVLPAKSPHESLPEAGEHETANAPGGWSLTETFVNGNAHPVAGAAASANVSYFMGADPQHWRPHVPSHTTISLGEVWPGITVQVEAHGRNVEKLFSLAPGVDTSAIRIRVAGANPLVVNAEGALVLGTGLGEVTLTAPIAWQEKNSARIPVAVTYAVQANEYGFTLGSHDPDLPVAIDPLLQSTYLGGSGFNEHGYAITIHPTTSEVYITGRTGSTNFPGFALSLDHNSSCASLLI